jgi:CPA2 family monovalent cation:H+ antiporter-2
MQVLLSMALIAGLVMLFGVSWQLGIALGSVFAMSSGGADQAAGRASATGFGTGGEIIRHPALQDLAVVPLLVIVLADPAAGKLAMLLGVALLKAVVVLAVILVSVSVSCASGSHFVARAKSSRCLSSMCC